VNGPRGDAQGRIDLLVALDELGVEPRQASMAIWALVEGMRGLDPAEAVRWLVDAVATSRTLEGELRRQERLVTTKQVQMNALAAEVSRLEARLERLLDVVERARKEPGLKAALKLADDEKERKVLAAVAEFIKNTASGSPGTPKRARARRNARRAHVRRMGLEQEATWRPSTS
jgi:chromosome segregation ATPase